MQQKPLELILARNFLTSLSTPAFLVDESGALIFYNEAAGALLGISFEESGAWRQRTGARRSVPSTRAGAAADRGTPITKALRRGKPAHGTLHDPLDEGRRLRNRGDRLPIVAEGGQEGAMIFFWTRGNSRGGD